MKSLRNMIIGAAALAASGASAMPDPAADVGAAPPARLIVGVYTPAAPVSLTRAEFPFGCWYPRGWHGPGYYWCGYRQGGWGGHHPWHHIWRRHKRRR